MRCGWSGHVAGFDFHHRDPTLKDFNICLATGKAWEVVRAELDKCELLCALCHRLHHDTRASDESLLRAVLAYDGPVAAWRAALEGDT